MPLPIRLIAIDLDGTLLNSEHAVPRENAQAIAAAVERGVEVAIVTGRRYDFAMPIANAIPCPLTMIVNNGALVKDKQRRTFTRKLLSSSTARKVIAATPEHRGAAMVMFDRAREKQVVLETIDWNDPARKGYFERNREYLAEVAPLEDCLDEDPIQVMYAGRVGPMRALSRSLAEQSWASEFSVALTEYEERDFSLVDVLRAGISKGATLAEWAAQRGYERSQVMAIGDNWNDREMLEFAGVAVVMGNAVDGLKQFGWNVTSSNDACGVAAAIEKYALDGRG
ncbi:MAG: HAD family phosphatase [Acidobacteria bacterium]|nr:HAD family phosphatase [Acidobacteriota bacterium]